VFRDRDRLNAELEPATLAVIAGRPEGAGEPLNSPPVFASAFESGEGRGYARRSNPTWEAFERGLGALEGGEAVGFATGMAAVTAVIESLSPGARVVCAGSAYVEVRELLSERAALGAIDLRLVDPLDTAAVLGALERADAFWLDAISNPLLDVAELDRILPAARRARVLTVIDSTLATPALVRPLRLGADVVVHSATKYIGGHSDLLLGAAVCRDPRRAAALGELRARRGAVPGTMEAWLGLRGLRTLPLRVERAVTSAGLLAGRLPAHRAVTSVRYPGLPGDPGHERARRVLDGFGAVVSFELADAGRADRACREVEVISHASSLGGVETLIERQGRWQRERHVPPALLRLSVGCEDPEDLWRDLDRALSACA
jgi:cystathionine gamma-synthase